MTSKTKCHESRRALAPSRKEAILEKETSRHPIAIPCTLEENREKYPSSVHTCSDSFCHLFSPGDFSDPQPPGTDCTDTSTDLLIQMFMSELGPKVHDLTPADIPSSPTPSLTPSLSPAPTPVLVPSPSLPSPPAQVPTCSSQTSSAPETPPHLPDLDDPFLVSFANLDGLLKDSSLFKNSVSTPSPVVDNCFMFPFSDPHLQDPMLLDLSECLSLCSSSLSPPLSSPHSVSSGTQTPGEPSLDLDSPASLPSPLPFPELTIHHDHSYISEHHHQSTSTSTTTSTTVNPTGQRKRKASEADSILTPASIASSPTKKVKQVNNGEKYHIRRQKNNVASQVSRAKRRAKTTDMFSSVQELEVANAQLRKQVEEMETEAAHLRKSLVNKLST